MNYRIYKTGRQGHHLFVLLTVLLFIVILSRGACAVQTHAAGIVSTNHQKYTYTEYVKDLAQLQEKYPQFLNVKIIGKSADNRDIYEVVLGDESASKHLVVIANLHAREYMTTQLTMRQIEYYLDNNQKLIQNHRISTVISEVCIHIVPSCNPDGTAISQKGFSAIRNTKLRKLLKKMGGSSKTWKANARGVDLNRNWNIAFKKKGKPGSSGYRGTKASSESEVKALVNMIHSIKKRGKVCGIISYHSTGSILFGKVLKQATSSVKSNTKRMSDLAKKLTKYKLQPTSSINSSRGCSREYFLYKEKIPCITIEVGKKPCPLKASEFSSIWKKNKDLLIREAMLFQ